MEPLFLYGNWAAYDEISDHIALTEELAMGQLDHILRLRRDGVRFDGYLMDAFWYAPDGAYREWRKPHWPNGSGRWLEACAEHRLLPGLWFTANTLFHLNTPLSWGNSVDEKGWGMCVFEGGFRDGFLDVLCHWYAHGIRVFKFDFAEFGAVPAGRDISDARRRNIEAFRGMLAEFRSSCPEVVLLAYNGFDQSECMNRTDRPFGSYVDSAWLDYVDSMYCGDPRPSDVPCDSFWRSVDVYSDHMARLFENSGIPLDRIDNCGFMAGNTGTCYWRCAQGWKGMLLLSLARGGRIHVSYGDLGLFSGDDAKWWARAQALLSPCMTAGSAASFGGVPGRGEPYGWLCESQWPSDSTSQHLDQPPESDQPAHTVRTKTAIVVNPGLEPRVVPLPTGYDWSLISHDGPQPPLSLADGNIRLSGGQLALFNSRPDPTLDLPIDPVIDSSVNPVSRTYPLPKSGQLDIDLPMPAPRRLTVQFLDGDESLVRIFPWQSEWPPIRVQTLSAPSCYFIDLDAERVVWSGLSWMSFELMPSTCRVRISVAGNSGQLPFANVRTT